MKKDGGSEIDVTTWSRFVGQFIHDAFRFWSTEPRIALNQARQGAEAICRHVFTDRVGEPADGVMLGKLIELLKQQKLMPLHVLVALRTVQEYGNYGTHPTELHEIEPSFATPCLAALRQVGDWYFTKHLRIEIPELVKNLPENPGDPVLLPTLLVIRGPAVGMFRPLPELAQRQVVIGRAEGVDIRIPDRTVSRQHAALERRGEAIVFMDRSGKGSIVDGELLHRGEVTLRDESIVVMGTSSIRLLIPSGRPCSPGGEDASTTASHGR
jgi:hypothetical protein